jgi:hypothetical protein
MKIDKLVRYAAGLGLVGAMFFACTGDLRFDPPDNPGPDAPPDGEPTTAREYFDQKVVPFLQQDNQCSCHTAEINTPPLFVGATADDTYNYLKADYPNGTLIAATSADSIFYTKPQATHYGAEWKGDQATYVSEWITREYEEYGQPPASPARQRFDTYIVPLLATCSACHGNAQVPVFVGATPDESYALLKTGYPSTLVNTSASQSTFYTVGYPNAHYGVTWADGEAAEIEYWIAEEYAEYSAGQ